MKARTLRFLYWISAAVLMLLLVFPAAAEETPLTNEEVTQILWELYQTENSDAEYVVLPDDYEEPAVGRTGIYHLLLLGIDNPSDAITGRSDTMLLASLNARTGELRLISFMRDTYVKIPRHGHNRLNAAYAYGGPELLIETLEKEFGVHVDGYVAVNYALMTELVDAIGGIDIEVEQAELKKLNGILEYYNYQRGVPEQEGRLEEAGLQHLTGLQAMSYARIRKLDSDFARVERQQRVILAIYHQLLTLDTITLAQIITAKLSKVVTNVTIAQAVSLMATALSFDDIKVTTMRVPADGAYVSRMINKAYFIVPKLERCRRDIQEFLYD